MPIDSWDFEQDGAFSERARREKLERRGYRVARYVYPPGTYFPDHTHDVDKIDAVVSGEQSPFVVAPTWRQRGTQGRAEPRNLRSSPSTSHEPQRAAAS